MTNYEIISSPIYQHKRTSTGSELKNEFVYNATIYNQLKNLKLPWQVKALMSLFGMHLEPPESLETVPHNRLDKYVISILLCMNSELVIV